jgi:hypothetical protein
MYHCKLYHCHGPSLRQADENIYGTCQVVQPFAVVVFLKSLAKGEVRCEKYRLFRKNWFRGPKKNKYDNILINDEKHEIICVGVY